MDMEAEQKARRAILGCLPWGLFVVCALVLLGLNALKSIEVNHQRKNAVQIIHWIQRAKTERASREEVRRFFTGGDQSEDADWFTYSPRFSDTWGIKVEYGVDGRVKDVQIDGRTPSEMAELYRPR